MKKKDIIKLVKETVEEMRSFYGSHDNFQPTGQRRNLSGLPGVMEEEDFDAKAEYEDLDTEKKELAIDMIARGEGSRLEKIMDYEKLKQEYGEAFDDAIKSLSSPGLNEDALDDRAKKVYQAFINADKKGGTNFFKNVFKTLTGLDFNDIDLNNKDNNHAALLNKAAIDLKRAGDDIMTKEELMKKLKEAQKLYTVTATDGTEKQVPFPSDADAKKAIAYSNIKSVEAMEEDAEEIKFTNDVGKDDYVDDEGRYAKSQLYKMGKYAVKLHRMLDDMDQLPAWLQSKITKASDYMSMVYHYLDYEFARRDGDLMQEMDKYKEEMLEEPNEISYADAEKQGLKNPDKADISKDKDISKYEFNRGMAIQKATEKQK